MVTPDLARAIGHGTAAVIALTLLGVLAAVIDPALGGHTRPHPTLTGTPGQALSILQTNARILAVPFGLAILRLPDTPLGRTAGDVAIAALTGLSTLSVGIALGRWGTELLPYLPHLPLEWAALSLAVAAWLIIRRGHAPARQLVGIAAAIAALLVAAAGVETFATPHRQPSIDAEKHIQFAQCAARRVADAQFHRPGPDSFKVAYVSLPLARRLGSAPGPAAGVSGLSTTGSPQGGNQR